MPEDERLPAHPEREEEPEDPKVARGRVIAAVIIGALFLLVALHLAAALSLHGA